MKVALVTGVSSGIGKATAARLSETGYRTFGTVRTPIGAEGNVEIVSLDVRDPASVEEGVATVFESAGRIDVLVNNAGASLLGAAEEMTVEEARDLFETNLFGLMRMTQAVLPAMRRQRFGRIVNISSVLGFLPAPFMSAYAATKHAVEGYSESLDHEVRGFGVRVSVIEPGFTKTGLGHNTQTAQRLLPEYGDVRERVLERLTDNIERGADPADVARIVACAVTARAPRLRYQVGREARLLRLLRWIAPAAILDQGIRKTFGLGVAS